MLKAWWRAMRQRRAGNLPPERLLKLPRHRAGTLQLFGQTWHYRDPLSFYWSWKEIFGDEIYRFPATGRAPRIIDGGANLGLASLYFLRRYPGARVTALEPDPGIFALLEKNLAGWPCEGRLRLLPKALAASANPRIFQSRGADAGRLSPTGARGDLTVACLPLDDLLSEPVDFLKLDLEGAETEVLEASRNLARVKYLFVEHHSFAGTPRTLDRLLRGLQEQGFTYWIRSQFMPDRPWEEVRTNEGMDLQLNIFAHRTDI